MNFRKTFKILPFFLFLLGIIPISALLYSVICKLNTPITNIILLIFGLFAIFYSLYILKHKRSITILNIFILTLLALYCSFLSINYLLYSSLQPQEQNTTYIVLGSKVNNNKPSDMLKHRLDTAIRHISENTVIVTGKGESNIMKKYIDKESSNKNIIYCENNATNTKENMEYSFELIKKYDLNSNITIVTSDFHSLRSYLYARKFGFTNITIIPSNTSFPSYFIFSFREVIALVKLLIETIL